MKMRTEIRSGMAMAAAWRAQRSSPSALPSAMWCAAITCAKPGATAYLGFGHTVNHPHRPPQEASM
jgi:hypothetical protein